MTIFDYLSDILFTKETNLTNADDEYEYNQYMVNRWASMYSPLMATLINNTSNWLYPILEDKSTHYNFLHSILPQVRRKHIPYIKKDKQKGTEEDINIKLMAKKLEISQREIKYFLDNT